MAGVDVPDKAFVGRFRSERGVQKIGVRVENKPGTPPGDVAQQLAVFERNALRPSTRGPSCARDPTEVMGPLAVRRWMETGSLRWSCSGGSSSIACP